MGRVKRKNRKRKLFALLRKLRASQGVKRRRKQKGGSLGAGLALGMMAPMLLGTLGKVLKINV
jgi:predicted lipid-binding transport protein (Tim44 family)